MTSRVKLQSESRVKTVLLIGAGYVARHLAPYLIERGYVVTATYRNTPRNIEGASLVAFGSSEMIDVYKSADIVLSSIPPGPSGDPVLEAVKDVKTKAAWVGYLSATSVYGDRGGQWAYEDEAPTPSLKRGRRRAEAEIAWIESGLPVHIFRLAGIYGLGRAPFRKIRDDKAFSIDLPEHVVNRVHVEDIVTALLASINASNPQRIYNIADGHPAPSRDVLNYAADLMDRPHPPQVDINDPAISDMSRSFYSECKRIDITRARNELSWEPRYSSYKEGLTAIYADITDMKRRKSKRAQD